MIDAAERAERLGAALLVLGIVREPATSAILALADLPLLTLDEWEAWRQLDDEDIALAHVCLEVEFALRDREWAAFQDFGAAWATGTGSSPEERIASMPLDAARAALRATFALGWNHPLPSEDG